MTELLTMLGLIGGGIVALGVIWRMVLVPFYRLVRKMETAHDIILEFPEWKDKVDQDLSQLHPNGGKSVKDILNKTREEIGNVRSLIEDHINSPEPHKVHINIESEDTN